MPSIVPVDHGHKSEPNTTMPDDHARQEPDNTAAMSQPAMSQPAMSQPAISQPSVSGRSGLESLPNELLMSIFDQLGDEEGHRGWATKSAVRSGCHGLCLASKRIHLIARPYLYKQISISGFRSLVRLCRTIAGDQNLGHEIREVDLNVDFDLMTKPYHLPLTPDRKAEVHYCYQIIGERGSETSREARTDSDLIGLLCYELLARAINLCSLTMVIGETESFHQDHLTFFNLVKGAARSAATGTATRFLPLLENLTLEGRWRTLRWEAFGYFLGLPSLRRIRSIGDNSDCLQLTDWGELKLLIYHLICIVETLFLSTQISQGRG